MSTAHDKHELSPPKRHHLHLARPSHCVDKIVLHGDICPKEVPHRSQSELLQKEADVVLVPVVVVFATPHPTCNIAAGGRGSGLHKMDNVFRINAEHTRSGHARVFHLALFGVRSGSKTYLEANKN